MLYDKTKIIPPFHHHLWMMFYLVVYSRQFAMLTQSMVNVSDISVLSPIWPPIGIDKEKREAKIKADYDAWLAQGPLVVTPIGERKIVKPF